jgi:PAS domain S-box-containing protein
MTSLDLLSVIKASQSISREIHLPAVQETLMRIVLEHAGAQRGFLLLIEGESLAIHAHAEIAGEETRVSVMPALPVPTATLPMSILSYVRRTGESVVLADAATEGIYTADEYIARQKPRSVLCLPIVRQAHLIGILYLENNLIAGVFTLNTLTVLELLASQAAISLDNARLYTDLQQENAGRRRLEEARRASEEQTRLIVDSAYDAFIAMDASGLITDWNQQAEAIFGWSREEAMGQSLAETIIPAQHREAYRWGLERFLATGKGPLLNRRIEATALHRDGHEFPVELTITPIRWRDSFIFSAFVHDITERKQAGEAAKESEERLRLTFEAARIGTGELNLQTNQITLSDAMQRVVGLAPGTVNLSFEEWVELVHPEDRANVRQAVENSIVDGNPDIVLDFRIVWPDGSVHWVTTRAKTFYDEAGRATRIIGAIMDITERKQAEDALRKAHEEYAALVNSIDGIVWQADARTFIFNFVSQQAERLLGYPIERWLTEPTFWKDHIHPDDQAWAVDFCVKATGEKRPHDFEYRMLAADGRVVWLRDIVTVVVEEDQAIRLQGVMVDITEQKRAEEATKESEERLRLTFEAAKIGTGELDLQTNQVTFSNPLLRVLGLTPDTVNPTLDGYIERVHPEDRARVQQAVEETIAGQSDIAVDYRIVWPDGSVHWVTSRTKAFYDGAGRATRIIGAIMDITERKQAEEKLRQSESHLAEAQRLAHIGSWSRDEHANTVTWSDELYRMYGVRPSEFDHTYEAVTAFTHPEDRDMFEGSVETALKTREPFTFYYRMIRPDGEERVIHVRGAVEIDEHGNPTRVYGAAQDVTELKRAEEELLKHREHLEELVKERTAELAVAKAEAEEAGRLKSAFLATMSHELRTPLNSIIGFTGIMLQGLAGPLNEEQQKQLTMIKSSARHLLNLINEVLDLSKIESGQVELRLESFDMRTLIDKTVQTLVPLAEKKQLQLITDVAPEVDQVISDRRRVEQILINLVNNAIKFTEQGQVRIECRAGDRRLLTSVVDTGIGIKPEDMPKLFTSFQQLDGTLARKHEGTGLGLAICKKLVALLGGEIWAESAWEGGSKFTFVLPLNGEEQDHAAADSDHRG